MAEEIKNTEMAEEIEMSEECPCEDVKPSILDKAKMYAKPVAIVLGSGLLGFGMGYILRGSIDASDVTVAVTDAVDPDVVIEAVTE